MSVPHVLLEVKPDEEIAKLYFDVLDLQNTMAGHKFRDEKRRHAGTDNEETAGDLIDDIMYIVNKLHDRCYDKKREVPS
tara:strand:- start:61 stop:297 length:237 start_codon:yes stop_codon:yes gene_type:complete